MNMKLTGDKDRKISPYDRTKYHRMRNPFALINITSEEGNEKIEPEDWYVGGKCDLS